MAENYSAKLSLQPVRIPQKMRKKPVRTGSNFTRYLPVQRVPDVDFPANDQIYPILFLRQDIV